MHAPELIELRKETPPWNNHLFVNDSGKFGWKVNTWEDTVLRDEIKGQKLRGLAAKHRPKTLGAMHSRRAGSGETGVP